MKKAILILTALASLTIANAEPIYGPAVLTRNGNQNHALGTHMAHHLTDAARAWKAKAVARGYSEEEASLRLRVALHENHNQLPPLPEPKGLAAVPKLGENQRVIAARGTLAVIDSNTLDLAGRALCLMTGGQTYQLGEMGIKALTSIGAAINLSPGDVVTLRNDEKLPVFGFDSAIYGAPITFHGVDYILIVNDEETFVKN
jgi:hypothetical protein